jgi:hypothetical protein
MISVAGIMSWKRGAQMSDGSGTYGGMGSTNRQWPGGFHLLFACTGHFLRSWWPIQLSTVLEELRLSFSRFSC